MKKFLFLILSICLAFTFALSGCSCEPDAFLEFDKSKTHNILSETLVYNVNYEENYKGITIAQAVNKSLLPSYDGTLTLNFETGKPLPLDITQHVKFDDIETFNYIKSVLDLTVVVDGKTYNDKLISEVYFYDAEWALAPVYSKTVVKTTYIAMDSTKIEADQNIYEYSTVYKNGKFTQTKKQYKKDANEDINGINIENSNEYTAKLKSLTGDGNSHDYKLRHAIDNIQLIYAIRNLNIKKDDSTTLPTITYMYNKPMNLLVKNDSESSFTFNSLTYNGIVYDQTTSKVEMPTKNLSISLSGTTHTGSKKYLTLQKDAVSGIANYALPVEYAECLFENASLNTLGALVYTLKTATITTK